MSASVALRVPEILEAYPQLAEYPGNCLREPAVEILEGRYGVRFARNVAELDEILQLRFRVFNVELGEGLEDSYRTGRDFDDYDPQCHHLMVWHRPSGEVVGTYRMQTWEMAARGIGYYTDSEIDLSGLPWELLTSSVEVGRACIAREHRATPVLFLLWKGMARYLEIQKKRWLLGPCSLPTQDPVQGWRALAELDRRGKLERRFVVKPRPGFECPAAGSADELAGSQLELPPLCEMYLRYAGKVCGPPVLDRRFGTIDFLVLFDSDELGARARRLFFG